PSQRWITDSSATPIALTFASTRLARARSAPMGFAAGAVGVMVSSRRIVQVSTIVVLTRRTGATLTQFAPKNNRYLCLRGIMRSVPARPEQLLDALGAFRRTLRRHVGAPFSPPLTSAQVELVRVVRREPGTSVAEAAEKLGVAPNTVSTLVGQLS